MIGPVVEVDGVNWYNLQTSETAGFVSGAYATANYGSAGMPSTSKTYVDILSDHSADRRRRSPTCTTATTVTVAKGTVLQLVNGNDPYSATVGGLTADSI